jgi:hypothetical protein
MGYSIGAILWYRAKSCQTDSHIVPKQLPADLNEQLLEALGSHSDGLGIEALVGRFRDVASKRTIQRRLTGLMAEKRVVSTGEARALRYKLAPIVGKLEATLPAIRVSAEGESYVPLSPAGAEIRALVRRPNTERIPVGYKREFFDGYRPNESAYLTPEIRAHLHRIGKTPEVARPAGTYARHILRRLLIDLSWASSRLEGNTYSLLETEQLVLSGQAAEGKDATETQMILNHKAAIEFLAESAEDIELTPVTLRNLHALLSDNLLPDPAACGRLRTAGVGIAGSVYTPLEVGMLIQECFEQILATARAITDPFEQSFFLMVQLPYLQPFEDVNKRVSRLSANIPLIKHNLCPLSFVDVPEKAYIDGVMGVYELNRVELSRDVYVWAYERSSQRYVAVRQSLGEPDPFRLRYREQLMQVVRTIVQKGLQPTVDVVKDAANEVGIPAEHLEHFVRLAGVELQALHEGNFARYRLRPSEFNAWAESRQKS